MNADPICVHRRSSAAIIKPLNRQTLIHTLIYGLSGGVLIVVLRLVEFKFLQPYAVSLPRRRVVGARPADHEDRRTGFVVGPDQESNRQRGTRFRYRAGPGHWTVRATRAPDPSSPRSQQRRHRIRSRAALRRGRRAGSRMAAWLPSRRVPAQPRRQRRRVTE